MRATAGGVPLLLALVATSAAATEARWPFDARGLVEVRTLQGLPREVTQLAGADGGIADAGEPFNATGAGDASLPQRRFIAAGSTLQSVVLAYEQGGRNAAVRVSGFVLERTGWRQVAAWVLQKRPAGLRSVLEAIYPERDEGLRVNGVPWRRYDALVDRTEGTRPRRRDGPLRAQNLSDVEVREIESAARRVWPGSIVNISGVVSGCPCEEGASCSDQVWIVAYRADAAERTKGLQLSRIGGRWSVGPLQAWWLELASLGAHANSYGSPEYWARWQSLYERFPACPLPATRSAAVTP